MGVQLLPLVLRIGMSTVQGKMQQWQLLSPAQVVYVTAGSCQECGGGGDAAVALPCPARPSM